jgi:hypothetical protein
MLTREVSILFSSKFSSVQICVLLANNLPEFKITLYNLNSCQLLIISHAF